MYIYDEKCRIYFGTNILLNRKSIYSLTSFRIKVKYNRHYFKYSTTRVQSLANSLSFHVCTVVQVQGQLTWHFGVHLLLWNYKENATYYFCDQTGKNIEKYSLNNLAYLQSWLRNRTSIAEIRVKLQFSLCKISSGKYNFLRELRIFLSNYRFRNTPYSFTASPDMCYGA
jgi:hypothetical protein